MAVTLPGAVASPAAAQRPGAQAAAVDTARTQVAAEIRAAASGKLRDFYAPRGYWPLWVQSRAIGPQADALLDLIESADFDGLNPRAYDPRELRRLVAEAQADGNARALARADVALSKAFAALVADMRKPSRSVRIRYLDAELEPKGQDAADILRVAALAPSLTDYVKSAGWMSPVYMKLRSVRARQNELWGDLPDIRIAEDAKLRPGSGGEEISALRERLGLSPDGNYDRALTARVRAFQAAHGLKADGIAGAMTLATLNHGPRQDDRRLALNMERARLLPGPWVRHIVVDAASARLTYYDEGAVEGSMKVVVGAKESQTPMMAGMVRYATLNPYWNIPPDLVQKTVAPRILKGTSLRKLNYEALSDWSATPARLDQSEVDWPSVAAGRQEVRVRQLPGGDNAMGRVKFMFPNDLGIYLHDTPSRELFAKPARQFSNGCVRLEDAQSLGRWLFGKALKPTTDEPEQHVPLPQPVPVYLTYLTAVPAGNGVSFLPDVYERDDM
ncbi:MAG: L,D-transpeptidase family protein [Sphingobium sp.]